MRIGLQLPSFTWPGGPAEIRPRLAAIARTAEAAGFASLWVMDHFFQLAAHMGWPRRADAGGLHTLGYLAAATDRDRLGAMVTGVVYGQPALLVKAVTTLDVLSGERAYLGIGAAWYEREAVGLGFPFPARPERFGQLEKTLRIARAMWSGVVEPFQAEFGDAYNLRVPDPGESEAKLAVLGRHCEAVGRDYDTIEKTSLVELDLRPGQMSSRDAIGRLRGQGEGGIQHVMVNLTDAYDLGRLEAIGREIIPAVVGVAA